MAKRKRGKKVSTEFVQECTVLPPHTLLFAPVDQETGGKFLRQLEHFLTRHQNGEVVLGSFRSLSDDLLPSIAN